LESGYWVYNPDALLKKMPYRIYREWLEFYKVEPFGQLPLRIGFVGAGLGALLGKPKGKRHWSAYDYMPEKAAPDDKESATPAEQFTKILGIAQMFGAEIKDPKGKLKKMVEENATDN
jgi:hypothetical protein